MVICLLDSDETITFDLVKQERVYGISDTHRNIWTIFDIGFYLFTVSV